MKIKIIVNLVAAIMLVVGFVILIKPYWCEYQLKMENNQVIDEFIEYTKPVNTESYDGNSSEKSYPKEKNESANPEKEHSSQAAPDIDAEEETTLLEKPFFGLYHQMQEYNRKIYDEKQSELREAFSYTTNDFDFAVYGITDNIAGYITIESLNLKMALYIGSNTENMRKGATVMNKTSMPIGGINTNCVIAAHRIRGGFCDIEALKIGDTVKINNLWEELDYTVVKMIVIDPYDVDKIKIFPKQDMITLLTCHPYNVNTQRYVVYCVRSQNILTHKQNESVQSSEKSPSDLFDSNASQNFTELPEFITYEELPDGIAYESSEQNIKSENLVRISGIVLTGLFLMIYLVMFIIKLKRRIGQ